MNLLEFLIAKADEDPYNFDDDIEKNITNISGITFVECVDLVS